MPVGIDACLEDLGNGAYDIQIASNGDILTQDFFDTYILVSLFSNRRANESEVLVPELRGGWIGNESTPGFEQGSGRCCYRTFTTIGSRPTYQVTLRTSGWPQSAGHRHSRKSD